MFVIVAGVRVKIKSVGIFLAVLLNLTNLSTPSFASGTSAPQVTVIIAEQLGWEDFESSPLQNLAWLRQNGAVALLSPGLPRPPSPIANNWASFTAGDVINTKNAFTGLLQRQLLANGDGARVVFEVQTLAECRSMSHLQLLDQQVAEWRAMRQPGSVLLLFSLSPADGTEPGSAESLEWDELCPIAIIGQSSMNSDSSLSSATTRTKGLIALRDIAPTILSIVNAPFPNSMTGSPAQLIVLQDRDKELGKLQNVTRLGELAIAPVSWFLGLTALFAIAGGMWTFERSTDRFKKYVPYLLRTVIAAPLAMLLAPCLPISSLPVYLISIIAIDLSLAAIPSIALITSATVLLILCDGLTGTRLIASTVISGYWLSGIRFYGIGNEYMGVLIGMAIVMPALLRPYLPSRAQELAYAILSAVIYLATIFILSYPQFGAKAGGAVTSVAALGPAWYASVFRKRPGWVSLLIATFFGFALVFVMAAAATVFHSPASHIQTAVAAVHHGKLGYIEHIAVRKAKMAVKTVLTAGGITAIAGLIPLAFLWNRSKLKPLVATYLSQRPDLGAVIAAGFYALVVTLLFNDSGSVAFLFMFGAMSLVLLHELMRSECDYSR